MWRPYAREHRVRAFEQNGTIANVRSFLAERANRVFIFVALPEEHHVDDAVGPLVHETSEVSQRNDDHRGHERVRRMACVAQPVRE